MRVFVCLRLLCGSMLLNCKKVADICTPICAAFFWRVCDAVGGFVEARVSYRTIFCCLNKINGMFHNMLNHRWDPQWQKHVAIGYCEHLA